MARFFDEMIAQWRLIFSKDLRAQIHSFPWESFVLLADIHSPLHQEGVGGFGPGISVWELGVYFSKEEGRRLKPEATYS